MFDPTPARTLKGHQGAVTAVRFNPAGTYCVSGGADKTVNLWNPHSGMLLKTYIGHGHEVLDLATASNNEWIVSCGGDKTVIQWDVASGNILRKLRGHLARVNCLGLNADNTVVVSGSYDATVRIWDLKSNMRDPVQTMKEAKDSICSIHIMNHEMVVGSVDGSIRIYDVRVGRVTTDTIGSPVTSVRFSSDGNCILASTLDSAVRLLDKDLGKLLGTYSGHVNESYKLDSTFALNDSHVLSGSEDGKLFVWSLVEAKIIQTIAAHKGAVQGVSHHPFEPSVLTSAVDGLIKVWKPPAPAEQDEIPDYD
ncbi:mitogen-activated protein kinase organizer 1 [Capsaspora owczarzaki ATCC 30864]|uniref:Mitogen-activated protein kinase organizer 1 n=1 Tax=Capsaspora owczarzaki (strain ATCC 30864) TaxID=595528 RepID=A0A0D2VZC8_CAPO3|nr:mitogen-activated protein kinase organizer 1 [Capsaspora owczarzaki ATCC 30864]KJE97182.1 mitogen-activated protein kinase organizer 1 [Capsaspora owczarzaki ATCC 30864]|eukprot:XP_004343504.1 mitogen-activated protein kinase organizer 1 [Capsaspora owczarzaki ATCC 30864]